MVAEQSTVTSDSGTGRGSISSAPFPLNRRTWGRIALSVSPRCDGSGTYKVAGEVGEAQS